MGPSKFFFGAAILSAVLVIIAALFEVFPPTPRYSLTFNAVNAITEKVTWHTNFFGSITSCEVIAGAMLRGEVVSSMVTMDDFTTEAICEKVR